MALIPVNSFDPKRVGTALSATFPDLAPNPTVTVLKDGFRNLVVESSGGQVFKVAKNWEASATCFKQAQCLPLLEGRMPVKVPVPRWHMSRSREFPFGVIGYEKLLGVPLDSSAAGVISTSLAQEIGACIATLHTFPDADAITGNVPDAPVFWYDIQRERNVILPMLRDELTSDEYETVAGWWSSFLADPRMRHGTPVIIHGDVEPGNLLIDMAGHLVGILDFEGLALGDAARDLAPLLQLGRDVALATIDHYHAAGGILDGDFEYRVQRYWELRGFNGMRLAIHHESQPEFDRALAGLRRGPLLNERTRKETQIWPPPPR